LSSSCFTMIFSARLFSSKSSTKETTPLNWVAWYRWSQLLARSKMEAIRPGLNRRYNAIYAFIEEIIRECMDSGEFKHDTGPNSVATILFAAVDGLVLHHATTDVSIDWPSVRHALVGMVLKGVKAGR
jgi:hypothetical protein